MTHRSRRPHWRKPLDCLAVLLAFGMAGAAPATDAVAGKSSEAAIRARVTELVNVARGKARRCGAEKFAAAPQLKLSGDLNQSARRHARDMAKQNYFEHRGADGSQPRDRVIRAGYEPRLTGENIALGPATAEEVVAGWLASPGHCANIMDARFQDIGVGVAIDKGRGKVYWVQNFGAPR